MHEDTERCVRAVQSKDARFDGWFFTAVITTGIYCRASCPVVPPKVVNMRFYPSAAAAQQAGFRACKRCRPDASPGSPEWNIRADLVARAMRLIADGVVDRDGVPGLAARLGYSVRQIERALITELGAGPRALARAQRAQTARTLIETSTLAMSDVAAAAGFASIRAFNDTVAQVFALSPTQLRRRGARGHAPAAPGVLMLRLPFRAPLCPDNLFGHLVATAVPGVEEWRDGAYRRTLRLAHGHGIVALRPLPDYIGCHLQLSDLRDLPTAISRCRRLLDLDADPLAVDDLLRRDPHLTPLVDKAPDPRGPASHRARPADHRPRWWPDPPVPEPDRARRPGPVHPGHASTPPRCPERADHRPHQRPAQARRRQRLAPRPQPTRRATGPGALDSGDDRHARPGRSRRVRAHRSRRRPRRPKHRTTRHPRRAAPPRQLMAPLARLRHPIPVGHR